MKNKNGAQKNQGPANPCRRGYFFGLNHPGRTEIVLKARILEWLEPSLVLVAGIRVV